MRLPQVQLWASTSILLLGTRRLRSQSFSLLSHPFLSSIPFNLSFLDPHQVQLWDADRVKQVRQLRGHSARVSALAWNGSTLSSGGRDTTILNHDVR